MLDNKPNQRSTFRTKNWVEINDDSRRKCNTNSQIKFKTLMLKSILCNCRDACLLASWKITTTGAGDDAASRQAGERNKGVISKNCSTFTDFKSKLNNTQIDNAKDLDHAMPIHNLIEYSYNYSIKFGSLLQFYRDEPGPNLADSK